MDVFISYNESNEDHNVWIDKLADDLQKQEGIKVVYAGYDLSHYIDKDLFMEKGIMDSKKIIVVATKIYKEKAKNRRGGVGIETSLIMARHNQESNGTGASNILVVMREPDSCPAYLESKIRINFTDDDNYKKELKHLVKVLKGMGNRARPEKNDDMLSSNLTRGEDVVKTIYHKRKKLIGETSGGTDFSGSHRIKFELWKVKTPKTEYILILQKATSINISETIDRALALIEEKLISIKSLTIIRTDNLSTLLSPETEKIKKKLGSVSLSQFSLSGFIHDMYSSFDSLSEHSIQTIEHFVDQPIYSSRDSEDSKLNDSTIDYLLEQVDSTNPCSAHLILAEGGDGKTSLSQILVNRINHSKNTPKKTPKKAILLSIEGIKDKDNYAIKSIFDIYNLFSMTFDNNPMCPRMHKDEFEISIFCGNIIIVIDGLDELCSVFKKRFDKKSFLKSLQLLNDQLGESSIILTSRTNVFSDNANDYPTLKKYYLKGFDKQKCIQYFNRRFRKDEDRDDIVSKATKYATIFMEMAKVKRLSPYVVDIIAQQCDEDMIESFTFKNRPYESNSELTDLIVYSQLSREETRQKLDISIDDMVYMVYCEIASKFGPSISLEKLRSEISDIFDDGTGDTYKYLLRSSLVDVQGGTLKFRHQFLYEYFMILYTINGILKKECTEEHIKAYARHEITLPSYRKVLKFVRKKEEETLASCYQLISKLRNTYKGEGDETLLKKAISFMIHLIIEVTGSKLDTKSLSKNLFGHFTEVTNPKMITKFFIYGEAKALDFSERYFSRCGFYDYPSFWKSNFNHASFGNTEVDTESGKYPIPHGLFDSTCKIKGWKNSGHGGGASEKLQRFFRSFYEVSCFVEKNETQMDFSDNDMGTRSAFFREALQLHMLYQSKDGKSYGVSKRAEHKVYDLITNGNSSYKEIHKILERM